MALLDVSELMYDADFCDYFNYTRRTWYVDTYGETGYNIQNLTGYGSMQPISKGVLDMFPDLQRTSGMMEVYTTTALSVATGHILADNVTWNNETYIVKAVADDFSNWGSGYFVAVLEKTDLLDTDPANIPHTEIVP